MDRTDDLAVGVHSWDELRGSLRKQTHQHALPSLARREAGRASLRP